MNNNIRSTTRSSLTKIEFFRKADGAKKMVPSKTENRGCFQFREGGLYSQSIRVPRKSVYEHCSEPTNIDFSFLDKCHQQKAVA